MWQSLLLCNLLQFEIIQASFFLTFWTPRGKSSYSSCQQKLNSNYPTPTTCRKMCWLMLNGSQRNLQLCVIVGLSERNASLHSRITKLQIKTGRIGVSRVISLRNLLPFVRDFMWYFPVTSLNWKAGSELCCYVEGRPMQSVPQLGSHDQTEGTWSSPRGAKRQMEQIERGWGEKERSDWQY